MHAKEAGQSFDEFEEALHWQAKGIDLERKFRELFAKKDLPHESAESETDSTDTFVPPEHVIPKTVPNAMV